MCALTLLLSLHAAAFSETIIILTSDESSLSVFVKTVHERRQPYEEIITLLLALTLLLSLGSTALASFHEYDPGDSTKLSQTITTSIPDNKITWYLQIPADVTIVQGGYIARVSLGDVKIIVDSGELSDKQKLEASLTYDGVTTDPLHRDRGRGRARQGLFKQHDLHWKNR